MKWPKTHFREFPHCNPHWKQKCGAFIEMLRKKSETLHKGFLYINTTCVNSPGLNSTLLHIGTLRPRHFVHKLFEMVGTAWILDLLNISDHFAFWTRPLSSLEIDILIFFRYNVKYKAFSLRKKLLAITFERRVLRTWGQHPWATFFMLFSGIPHLAIFFHICSYAHMPICPKYAHNGYCFLD